MNDSENISPVRAADERLLHALLLQTHAADAAAHRDARVQRALQAIRHDAPPSASDAYRHPALRRGHLPRWAWRSAWAAAAILLLMAGVLVLNNTTKPAYASLNDIVTALSRPGDRTFRISVEPLDRTLQPKAALNGATLYLRDGRQYLMERPDPAGGFQFDGFDGKQSWRINSGRVVEIRDGLGAGGPGISPSMSDALFADLQPTLAQIGTDYTVERFDQAALAAGGPMLRHVLARHKPGGGGIKGPPVIEIWADVKTGMPRRIVFDEAPGSVPRRTMSFDLLNETTLPADWFTPSVHTGRRP